MNEAQKDVLREQHILAPHYRHGCSPGNKSPILSFPRKSSPTRAIKEVSHPHFANKAACICSWSTNTLCAFFHDIFSIFNDGFIHRECQIIRQSGQYIKFFIVLFYHRFDIIKTVSGE